MILFLNKMDVFAEKIRVRDLRQPNPVPGEPDLFSDYTGSSVYTGMRVGFVHPDTGLLSWVCLGVCGCLCGAASRRCFRVE